MKTTHPTLRFATLATGLALSAVFVTSSLQAQTTQAPSEPLPRIAIGANVGTLGYGPAVLVNINEHFTANLGYTFFNYSYDYKGDSHDVNAKLKFSNIQALLNWHPMAGNFRLSAGVFVSNNKMTGNVKANSADGYSINHNTYLKSEISSVLYNVELSKGTVPYLGLGWSKTPKKKGFGFFGDIGVMFMNSPKTKISPLTTNTMTVARYNQLKADVAADEAETNDDLSSFKYYPVIQGGVMYRF